MSKKLFLILALWFFVYSLAISASAEKFTDRIRQNALDGASSHSLTDQDVVIQDVIQNRAGDEFCNQNYFEGSMPKILTPRLKELSQHVCYPNYASYFSGLTRTPLWSANHLTKDRISIACQLKQRDDPHPDPNLAPEARSEVADYLKSGFDFGHLVSSLDAASIEDQADVSSLVNVVPQDHANNIGVWLKLGNAARNLALLGHDVFVVSGPFFDGNQIQQINNRVIVPSGLFKAIFDASTHKASVYMTPNTSDQIYSVISVKDASEKFGIDPFPSIPEYSRENKLDIMPPSPKTQCYSW
ncbi:DNA/RNA non-specific endonuclease [Methylomonas sp. AM2-LC]|uniref:DNA/RNA non-specific endonuclease n=1 Tax=Methylomonas sp. AM2-LC TaxID=3153301 RepID=UPI0032631D46